MGVGLEIIRGFEPTVGLGVLLGSVATFNIVRVLVRRFPTSSVTRSLQIRDYFVTIQQIK